VNVYVAELTAAAFALMVASACTGGFCEVCEGAYLDAAANVLICFVHQVTVIVDYDFSAA
jgi:hypothetical protein